ncbi:hypothetical protein TRVA0_022S01200 [Trichomonascus vanleenenianus]|uniref:SCF ubiquitin ligase complex subunit HRT3 n=1 Tax=Trichomonascus vanleenenianus TaxID=2268995 RepID=UPI003ECB33E8
MELDEFRAQWRQEIAQRERGHRAEEAPKADHALEPVEVVSHHRDEEPTAKDKAEPSALEKPQSKDEQALELFESAVQCEHAGKMADAVRLYRSAYRLNEKVDKLYRERYFSKNKPPPHHHHYPHIETNSASEEQLMKSLEAMSLRDHSTETEQVIEQGPIVKLPSEILAHILTIMALKDIASFVQMTLTCRKMAYVGYKSSSIWRALCLREYPKQHYTEDAIEDLGGDRDDAAICERFWKHNWRKMYLERPRVWLNGIYVSTSTYTRQGVGETWNAPIHMVTYYRYLRFFEDGTCLSLLSVAEPHEVVPIFNHYLVTHRDTIRRYRPSGNSGAIVTYNLNNNTSITFPKGISYGNWVIQSGDGNLLIETEGSVDKYTFYLSLQIKSTGRHKHNKLKWARFWSVNKLSGNEGDFSLRNDKPYYFVKPNWLKQPN